MKLDSLYHDHRYTISILWKPHIVELSKAALKYRELFYISGLKADPNMDFVPRTIMIGGKVFLMTTNDIKTKR